MLGRLPLALCVLLAAPLAAQVTAPDLFYTDQLQLRVIRAYDRDQDGKYTSPGEWVSWHRSTDLTPRVQSLRFYQRPQGLFALWTDRNAPGVFLANLAVKSGRLNRSEAKKFFPLDGPDDAVMDKSGIVWAINDWGQNRGLWRLVDLNKDGDAMDPGESTLMVASTLQITVPGTSGPVTIGGDDFEGMGGPDSRGYILAFEQTDEVVYAFKDINNDGDFKDPGEAINFLNYSNKAGLLQNPDFKSGAIPPLQGLRYANLEMIAMDTSGQKDVYYFGVYFGPTSRLGHVYQGIDLNGNGHLNDVGEVKLFYDGVKGPVKVTIGEGMDWYVASLYLMDDNRTNDRVIELTDLNFDRDALDSNEQRIVYTDPNGGPSTGPFSEWLAVVPPGIVPRANSIRGQTFLNGTPVGGGQISFSLTDLDAADEGGTGYVALSLLGDGRITGGIPLNDGPNRFVPIDFDNLTALSLTVLLPSFTTGKVQNGAATTPNFTLPKGLPPGIAIYAAGVIWTRQNKFGSITDAIRFVTQ